MRKKITRRREELSSKSDLTILFSFLLMKKASPWEWDVHIMLWGVSWDGAPLFTLPLETASACSPQTAVFVFSYVWFIRFVLYFAAQCWSKLASDWRHFPARHDNNNNNDVVKKIWFRHHNLSDRTADWWISVWQAVNPSIVVIQLKSHFSVCS